MRRVFKPSSTRPEDFDVFWDSTRDQLWRIDPEIERQPVETADDTGVCLEMVSFASLGRVRVSAYYLHWPERKANFFGRLGYRHDPGDEYTPLEETLEALGVNL